MKYYGFDDVRVVPIPSNVNSRDTVGTSIKLSDFLTLEVPIIASPMRGITSPELIVEVAKAGGIGILHKFEYDLDKRLSDMLFIEEFKQHYGVAIGLGYPYWVRILDRQPKILCIDIANGYLETAKYFTERVKNYITSNNYKTLLMVGNVITPRGFRDLYNAGADLVRCGISTGQLCITGDVTGVSMPPISMLEDINLGRKGLPFAGCETIDCKIIMDGGMRNSGDIVKSLIAGADAVMIGSLFGKTIESDHKGIISGMASEAHQLEYYHTTKSIEGISKAIEKTTTVEYLMRELIYGIKSACTYVNAKNIVELKNNGRFIYLD